MPRKFGSGSLLLSTVRESFSLKPLRESIRALPKSIEGFRRESEKKRGATFTGGLTLFVLANVIQALSTGSKEYKYFHKWEGSLLWAVGQTCGLFMMVVDLDVNHYFGRNHVRLVALLVFWGFVYMLMLFTEENAFTLPRTLNEIFQFCLKFVVFFPFLYLCARFREVLNEREGFPRLTELFTLIFALDLVGRMAVFITKTEYGAGYQVAMIGTRLVGFVVMLVSRPTSSFITSYKYRFHVSYDFRPNSSFHLLSIVDYPITTVCV
jgi:hypothetical protein